MHVAHQLDTHPVIVVGAGISGIACARVLAARGVPVLVLDRGARIGGRMAARTYEGRPVDLGASYFTVSDPRFRTAVDDWAARGLAHEWTSAFAVSDGGAPQPGAEAGPMRWGAAAGLRSLVEDLARGLDIEQRTVTQVAPAPGGELAVDGQPARAVVLAMPDPQAARLLHSDLADDAAVLDRRYEPVLALTGHWPARTWQPLHGVFVNGDPELTFIADDGLRRGDGEPVLVAHSTPELAAGHLEEPSGAEGPMLDALRRVMGIGKGPSFTHMHRWTFARPAGTRDAAFHLGESGLGVCGDGWGPRPRVEAAYLSGLELGEALAARLS